jgi:hypothetical protein
MDELPALPGQQTSLGLLLAQAVDGVVQAQRVLDEDARSRVAGFVETPQGDIALPPLWYTFSEVTIELELAAALVRRSAGAGAARLDARLLNPASVSLFGYAASSGLRVTLKLAPR